MLQHLELVRTVGKLSLAFTIWILCLSAADGQDHHVFFGLLHGHTSFSDGLGDPDEAFTMGQEAGLDFMAITEHNHHQAAGSDGIFLTPQLYGQLIGSARNHTVNGEFVAIWGQEVSTISSGNHVNIFFANEMCNIPNGDFKTFYEQWLPDHPEVPFVQFNHPNMTRDFSNSEDSHKRKNDYGYDDYDEDFSRLAAAANAAGVALIEVINGPAKTSSTTGFHRDAEFADDYTKYLNEGFRLAPSVGQDNHKRTWGRSTHARMGVWAEELSPEALIDAIRARRTYASEDDSMVVRFTVNDAAMGSTVGLEQDETVEIAVSVEDPNEPEAEYRVRLLYDEAIGGDTAAVIEDVDLAEEGQVSFFHAPAIGGYYFVRVTQDEGHRDDAWTAPVWIAPRLEIGTVAMDTDDPELDEIAWDQAGDYIGEDVTVTGKIIRSYKYRDRVVFFNFDPDFETTLSLVLLDDNFDAFGGASELQSKLTNKTVRVKGTITLYRNQRMQILLTDPAQILEVQ